MKRIIFQALRWHHFVTKFSVIIPSKKLNPVEKSQELYKIVIGLDLNYISGTRLLSNLIHYFNK